MTEPQQPSWASLPDRLPPNPAGNWPTDPYLPLQIPPEDPPRDDTADAMRIGLWGPTSSGKTTFVNALALVANSTSYGKWRVIGLDDGARIFLNGGKQQLIDEGTFPGATQAESELRIGFAGRRTDGAETSFVLHVQDRPGGDFLDRASPDVEKVARQLNECQGFVLLFDPLREERDSDSATYLFGMLERISTLVATSAGSKLYLPFEVAVCVMKWDDPGVFLPARTAGWGTQEHPDEVPRVKQQHAREYFSWACQHFGKNAGQPMEWVIEKYFDPQRTCYFVTSSVGFKLHDGIRFDAQDYANVQGNRVGKVNPINVIEPLLELEKRLREP